MKNFILVSFLLVSQLGFAQYKGNLEINGSTQEISVPLKGCLLTLYIDTAKNGTYVQQEQLVSGSNAKFKFKLKYNTVYLLECSKGGHTTKKVRFDTEVKESKLDSVTKFEFIVDMIPDKDGRQFIRPVANVFYHIKKNMFDYELDYTKEEQEFEEKAERERLLKEERDRIAAEEKANLLEKAKELNDADAVAAQLKIENALKAAASNDKNAIISQFKSTILNGVPNADEKAKAMYEKLIEERAKVAADSKAKLNYKAILQAAKEVDLKAKKEEEARQKDKEKEIFAKRDEAERQQAETLKKQQAAVKDEMIAKLEAADKLAAAKKAKERELFNQKVTESIVKGAGNKDATISNLKSVFPKNDPYAQQKAEAIFEEYAKRTLNKTGNTTAGLDFDALFAAAEKAEIKAISDDDAKTTFGNTQEVKEYYRKEAEKLNKNQKAAVDIITNTLKNAKGNTDAIITGFEKTFEKTDPFKREKSISMYVQYVKDLKKSQATGTQNQGIDFQAMFDASAQAQADLENGDYVEPRIPNLSGQEEVESKEEHQRKAKEAAMKDAESTVLKGKLEEDRRSELEKRIIFETAVKKGIGNRVLVLKEIMSILPNSTKNKEERAEAMYNNYLAQKKRKEEIGDVGSPIDIKALYTAGDDVEASILEKSYTAKMTDKEKAEDERKTSEFNTKSAKATIEAEERLKRIEEENKGLKTLATDSKAREEEIRRISQAQLAAAENERKTQETERKAKIETAQKAQIGVLESELAALNKQKADRDIAEKQTRQVELSRIQEEEVKIKQLENERLAKLNEAKTSTAALASAETARLKQEEADTKIRETNQKMAAAVLAAEEAKASAAAAAVARESQRVENIRNSNILAQLESEVRNREEKDIEEYIANTKKNEVELVRIEGLRLTKERDAELAKLDKTQFEANRKEQAEKERSSRNDQLRLEAEAREAKTAAERQAKEAAALQKQRDSELASAEKNKFEDQRLAEAEKERQAKQESARMAAEQKAILEAERLAREEREKADRESSLRLAAEAKAAKSEEERKQKEAESQAKLAAAERYKAEQAKAEADRLAKEEQVRIAKAQALALAAEEKAREEAATKERAENEKIAKEQAAKAIAEAKSAAEAERLAKIEKDRAAKAESDRLAAAEKARIFAETKAKADALAEAKAKADREAAEERARQIADAKAKAEAEKLAAAARLEKAKADAKARLDAEAQAKAEAERLAKAEADAKAKAEADRIAKAQADAKAKAEADQAAREAAIAKAKADATAKALADAAEKAKFKAEADAKIAAENSAKEAAIAKAKADAEAKFKLEQDRLAKIEADKRAREEAAKLAYTKEKAAQDSIRNASTAAYLAKQQSGEKLSEEERKKRFEAALAEKDNSALSEKERREKFLSQLSSVYPNGVTEETIQEKEYKLYRFIVNNAGQVSVYEKKTWNWGGIFYFKNVDITITATLFDLEVRKYKN